MTPLLSAQLIAKAYGLSSLSLKLEFVNPTGSHKDRAAETVVDSALRSGYDCVTVGSCGSYGVSISYYAQKKGIQSIVFVPESFQNTRVQEMEAFGAFVKPVPGVYEDAVDASRSYATTMGIYDANAGGAADAVLIECYGKISAEICKQMHTADLSVWVPVGNGTTLAGIYAGFKKFDGSPIMYGVGSLGNTSATSSVKAGFPHHILPESLNITSINEPLVNYKSFHTDLVFKAINESGGAVFDVRDDEMTSAAITIEKIEGLHVTPIGAVTLAALINSPNSIRENRKHVVIVTSNTVS